MSESEFMNTANLIDYKSTDKVNKEILLKAYRFMYTARSMSRLYEEHKTICSKYVHSTSAGHEAVQVASAMLLKEYDYCAPYYRDDAMLIGIGLQPYELMLQLLGKANDPFSGGRTYYAHPSLRRKGFPTIPHQSSATGMQAIPATGMAHGIAYLESQKLLKRKQKSLVLCSLGDGAVTEGEVSEAFQMAILKKLPIVYLIQDNDWGISAKSSEMRTFDAYEFAAGFKGMERLRVNGSDFSECYKVFSGVYDFVRQRRGPVLVHVRVPLLGHHTSGVRKEWYRGEEDIQRHEKRDPLQFLRSELLQKRVSSSSELDKLEKEVEKNVEKDFQKALNAADPDPATVELFEFSEGGITEEQGVRVPKNAAKTIMVDAALHAVDDILKEYPEALFYGQDVGGTLGGVFREAALLAKKYGDDRVFNTPIQEAYIIGSTAGMSAVGCKPIVEIQFADYVWPGINQLVEELSKSCYLSNGKFPIQALIRVPIGAYGGGGPYHSGSVESALLTIRGIKVVYPSNAADMKGLMKAAFLDPNPVVMLEHKGLYWSKVPGTEDAKCVEPDEKYVLPLGKAYSLQQASEDFLNQGLTAVVITYGMGVYWAKEASKKFQNRIEILDLRTLNPLDEETVFNAAKRHGRVLVLTEEPLLNSFAESLAGRISKVCFEHLDAPVFTIGAKNLPAVPLNVALEKAMLPSAEKVEAALEELLNY